MIGLDTNILVRYFTQDDPVQSPQATQIMERLLTENKPGFINLIAMVETVWVLERAYGMQVPEIAKMIEYILQADTLFVQNEQEVFTAMVAYKAGVASFSDALIATLGTWAGCSSTLTFDKKATRWKAFEHP